MDSVSELKLVSLVSQLLPLHDTRDSGWESKIITLIIQIISLVRSMDLDAQPKPQSKLMSLVTQTVSLLNSMDLDSMPKPLLKLLTFFSHKISSDSDQKSEYGLKLKSVVYQTLNLLPDPELMSLIRQIVSLVTPISSELQNPIFLCPQVTGSFYEGKFRLTNSNELTSEGKWSCFFGKWEKFRLKGEDVTYFRCKSCNGEYHKEYDKAPVELKHPLHPKHSLQLASNWYSETRKCYCCDEDLMEVFYYCSACDYAMNIACAEKAPVLYMPPPKWHEHKLALFPRRASLTCNVCALADSSSPLYMCPPCDFVVHLRCNKLPRVIRISRHPHRIYFTPSFDEGNWFCSVCRREINNDYGSYSCIKDGCSYAVHSRCATQSNVWDGIDLEEEPEDIEEEDVEPFVRIRDEIIRHFSHEHHLRLDENTSRDYDDNMHCEECITPIYFGNLYSCLQCEFVLHETCANLSRKLYHPIHPHLLTLALVRGNENAMDRCTVCYRYLTAGFFYGCPREECHFKLHVQCAKIYEPLIHVSHSHPLFLTSKPGEQRKCSVCQTTSMDMYTNETFNCIKCDDFALCFTCAAIPQKVRYKHDKHILTLCYEDETYTMTYWCEVCERKINPKKGFYMCGEYSCVTLHIRCLTGRESYMKPGSSVSFYSTQVGVLPNNRHMSRPICSYCERRCSDKIYLQLFGSKVCSTSCMHDFISKFTLGIE